MVGDMEAIEFVFDRFQCTTIGKVNDGPSWWCRTRTASHVFIAEKVQTALSLKTYFGAVASQGKALTVGLVIIVPH
jgi:hypothetical protein